MTEYILFAAAFWCWCVLFFILIQKPLFLFLNRESCPEKITFSSYLQVIRHGFVTDAIVASYLCAVPLILGLIHFLFPSSNLSAMMLPYNILAALTVAVISLGDAVLYSFWGSKIESSIFIYLQHPKSVIASVSTGYVLTALVSWLFLSGIFFAGGDFISETAELHSSEAPLRWWSYISGPLLFIAGVGVCFIIIRGLRIRPNNPSVAYFSPVSFLNHWALNPVYNLIYSLSTRNEYRGHFRAFDDEEAKRIIAPLFPVTGTPQLNLLNTATPNILTIVWESFGAEFCGAIGGREEVTPCFNRLCEEGVLFTNCVSSSFRTDRAQPAIFCGLPGQPTTSIIRHSRKLPNLSAWTRDLREKGYDTTAVHASDLTVMHMSEFFLAAGHNELVDQNAFPRSASKCKWGFHDHEMFRLLYDIIEKKSTDKTPWLISALTLSSHEPFVVPYRRLEDDADNSMAYTDASLGEFMDKLKASPAWDNLLVIIVADHSLNRPGTPESRAKYAHIPLLLTGGAVKGPMKIDTLMNQTDIAAILLGQLGLPHDKYIFSRDVLADTYRIPSAMHTYINGFLFTDESGHTDYDNVSSQPVNNTDDENRERRGKAILQILYDYIDKLG